MFGKIGKLPSNEKSPDVNLGLHREIFLTLSILIQLGVCAHFRHLAVVKHEQAVGVSKR